MDTKTLTIFGQLNFLIIDGLKEGIKKLPYIKGKKGLKLGV